VLGFYDCVHIFASPAPPFCSVLHAYRSVVEYGLGIDPSLPDATVLQQSAAGCLLRLLDAAPSRLSGIYSARLSWLLRWLQVGPASVDMPLIVVSPLHLPPSPPPPTPFRRLLKLPFAAPWLACLA
jgi:hypothetical protein